MPPPFHEHACDFRVPPAMAAPFAAQGDVDAALLDNLLAAAFDRCPACQSPLLDRIGHLPATVGVLVGVSVALVVDRLGGLPTNMHDARAPGVSSAEYRHAVAAGIRAHEPGVVASVRDLTPQRRRLVAEDALEITLGVLILGGP